MMFFISQRDYVYSPSKRECGIRREGRFSAPPIVTPRGAPDQREFWLHNTRRQETVLVTLYLTRLMSSCLIAAKSFYHNKTYIQRIWELNSQLWGCFR